MVKSHHLIYLSLALVVGLLASLVTMVAMNHNPLGNLETAHAQSVGASDFVAVPLSVQPGQEYLAVVSKVNGPGVRGGEVSDELALAIYSVSFSGGNDAALRWMATRRIEYDLQIPHWGLHRDQATASRGANFTPAGIYDMIQSWQADNEEGGSGRRR